MNSAPRARWILVALCLVLLPGMTGAVAPARDSAGDVALSRVAELFAKGYKYQTGEGVKKDLKRALVYYAKALKGYPSGYPQPFAILYNSALIYVALDENHNAQRYFIRAARAARALPELRHGEAVAQVAARSQAMARNGLGSCYQRDGKLKAAEKQYRAAIQLYPGLIAAHFNLLNLLTEQQRWDEMERALAVAREAAPSPRYGIFAGRRAGKEGPKGHGVFSGMLGVGVTAAVLGAYYLLLRVRRSRR